MSFLYFLRILSRFNILEWESLYYLKQKTKMQNQSVATKFTASTPKYTDGILATTSYTFLEYHMIPEPQQFNYAYRPSDDTFLLLSSFYKDIISSNQSKFQDIFQLGCGSGILSAHVSKWLQKTPPLRHICADINPDACMMASRYFGHYNFALQVVHSSLFSNLAHNYHSNVSDCSNLSKKLDEKFFHSNIIIIQNKNIFI